MVDCIYFAMVTMTTVGFGDFSPDPPRNVTAAQKALDVRQECSTYGSVLSVIIPRVKEGYDGSLQGHIYVEFASPTEAHEAAMKLCGRKFGDQLVVADFLNEHTYSEWKQKFGAVA